VDASVRNGTHAHNNALDAARYSYVTGRLAMDFGSQAAVWMGREHGQRNHNSTDLARMDLHNNATGSHYAVGVINGAYAQPLARGETLQECLFELAS
jgi:hypothetical protein